MTDGEKETRLKEIATALDLRVAQVEQVRKSPSYQQVLDLAGFGRWDQVKLILHREGIYDWTK